MKGIRTWVDYDENDRETWPPDGQPLLLAFYDGWSTSPVPCSPWYMGIGVVGRNGEISQYDGQKPKRLDGYDKLHLKAWMLYPDPPTLFKGV